eukprot:jgi/Mesvir1/27094/Mv20779-RA.1
MVHLEPDPFLNELTKLFEKTKTTGTVFLTMKRSSCKHPTRKNMGETGKSGGGKGGKSDHHHHVSHDDQKCLVRATDGKKRKISTTITAKEVVRFQMAYATLLKAHMDALKKRDKKQAKKKGKGT